MTIEEKARAYDKAIERARDYYKQLLDEDNPEWAGEIEKIFPELKESEDEKNIKDLIDELKCSLRVANCQNDACRGGHEKRIALLEWAIAWLEKQAGKDRLIQELGKYKVKYTQEILSQQLEKQGEQKEYTFKSIPRLLEMIEPTERAKAYCQKLIDTLMKEGYATDAKIVGECLKKMNGEKVALATMDEKQGEQKSKWGEEDEIRLDRICKTLWKNRKGDTDEIFQQEQDVDWLKTLKPQNTWKPSDEQIKAIRLARSFVVDAFGEHPTLSEILMELEEQLQKIKENKL